MTSDGFVFIRHQLHIAIDQSDTARVTALLDQGADIEVRTRDRSELTPLHVACRHANGEIATLLLDRRADINAQNGFGETASRGKRMLRFIVFEMQALFLATHYASNDLELLNLLLQRRADVNLLHHHRISCLHNVVAWKPPQVAAALLLEHQADCNVVPSAGMLVGMSPADYASAYENAPLARMLRRFPAWRDGLLERLPAVLRDLGGLTAPLAQLVIGYALDAQANEWTAADDSAPTATAAAVAETTDEKTATEAC